VNFSKMKRHNEGGELTFYRTGFGAPRVES
jgi:hypothetical protein